MNKFIVIFLVSLLFFSCTPLVTSTPDVQTPVATTTDTPVVEPVFTPPVPPVVITKDAKSIKMYPTVGITAKSGRAIDSTGNNDIANSIYQGSVFGVSQWNTTNTVIYDGYTYTQSMLGVDVAFTVNFVDNKVIYSGVFPDGATVKITYTPAIIASDAIPAVVDADGNITTAEVPAVVGVPASYDFESYLIFTRDDNQFGAIYCASKDVSVVDGTYPDKYTLYFWLSFPKSEGSGYQVNKNRFNITIANGNVSYTLINVPHSTSVDTKTAVLPYPAYGDATSWKNFTDLGDTVN